MTIRRCFWHADLVSYSSFYISSNISVSLRNLIIFSTSQFFPSSVPMSPWILYFFLLSHYWGSLVGNILLLVFGFHMLHLVLNGFIIKFNNCFLTCHLYCVYWGLLRWKSSYSIVESRNRVAKSFHIIFPIVSVLLNILQKVLFFFSMFIFVGCSLS